MDDPVFFVEDDIIMRKFKNDRSRNLGDRDGNNASDSFHSDKNNGEGD